MFRDSGSSDAISVEVDASSVNDRPTLTQYDVPFTTSDTGKQFRFQIAAHNAEGETISQVGAFIIANFPDKPTQTVARDLTSLEEY